MTKTAIVPCFSTPLGVFISCPTCKAKRLMRLYPETSGESVALSAGDRPGPCDPAGNQHRSRLTGPVDHPPCLDGIGTAGPRTGGRTFSDGGRERWRGNWQAAGNHARRTRPQTPRLRKQRSNRA